MLKQKDTNLIPKAQERVREQRIVIRTLNVFTQPFWDRYDQHYHPRHTYGHVHLVLDAVMVMAIIGLVVGVVVLFRYRPAFVPFSSSPHVPAAPTVLTASAGVRLTTLEGEPLWAGPLPLVVGRETRLRAFFDVAGIQATHHNLVLSASVASPATIVAEHATANDGSLVVLDRTVRWDIGTAPADRTVVQASVEVSVTPTQADRGKALPLFTAITLHGEDSTMHAPSMRVLPDVTTRELPNNAGIVTE